MILRVVTLTGEKEEFIGTMEADEAPAVGDLFYWKQHGPYRVISRTWHLPPEFDNRAEGMTLTVELTNMAQTLGHALAVKPVFDS
jgi:hypothetical protein